MLVAFQINVADIDPITGVSTKSYTAFALSGFVRGHVSALPLSPCLVSHYLGRVKVMRHLLLWLPRTMLNKSLVICN
jgi:hypothetical protein